MFSDLCPLKILDLPGGKRAKLIQEGGSVWYSQFLNQMFCDSCLARMKGPVLKSVIQYYWDMGAQEHYHFEPSPEISPIARDAHRCPLALEGRSTQLFGPEEYLEVYCFPYLLRRFTLAQLLDYQKTASMTVQNYKNHKNPLYCHGDKYPTEPEEFVLGQPLKQAAYRCPLPRTTIMEEGSFAILTVLDSVVWYTDYEATVFCDECAHRLKGNRVQSVFASVA